MSGKSSGDLSDPLFVQRLGHEDNLLDSPGTNRLIQRADITYPHDIKPFSILVEHSSQLGESLRRKQPLRVLAPWETQDKSIGEVLQTKCVQRSCGRHHVPVRVVGEAIQGVEMHMIIRHVFQQLHFVVFTTRFEDVRGFGHTDAQPLNRKIIVDKLAHVLLKVR